MSPKIDIRRPDPARAVVVLTGEHDSYTAEKLAQTLTELLDEGCSVVVDLTTATFIDSQTAAALVAARRRAEEEEADFGVVIGPKTGWPVRHLLDVTGLRGLLGVSER